MNLFDNTFDNDCGNCVNEFFNKWNSYAEKYKLHSLRKLTLERRRMISAIIESCSPEEIKDLFKAISEQPFLHGQRWFTLDWLSNETNLCKVLERQYKDTNSFQTNVESKAITCKRSF